MPKAKLNKSEYDGLGADDQKNYEVVGDGDDAVAYYIGEIEDVSGLKKNRDDLKAELQGKKALLEKFKDIDPDKATEALAKIAELEEADLMKKEDWDTLKQNLETKHTSELEKANARADSYLAGYKNEAIKTQAVENGIKADRLKYVVPELSAVTEAKLDDNGSLVLELDQSKTQGVEDLPKFFEQMKKDSPFLFGSETTSGGGAGGSGEGGEGNSMSRAEFDALPDADKHTFMQQEGATLVD